MGGNPQQLADVMEQSGIRQRRCPHPELAGGQGEMRPGIWLPPPVCTLVWPGWLSKPAASWRLHACVHNNT